MDFKLSFQLLTNLQDRFGVITTYPNSCNITVHFKNKEVSCISKRKIAYILWKIIDNLQILDFNLTLTTTPQISSECSKFSPIKSNT